MFTVTFEEQLEDALARGYVAAFRWLRNRHAAEDACQEAAARALGARGQYDPGQPFYPWFYRILKNHCVDRVRRGRSADAGTTVLRASTRPADDETAEDLVLDSEREQAVARAVARLPDDLREMIELRHFQDLSYREMADILGCPDGTVMSRLYRARKALRALLLGDPGFMERTP